MFAFIKKIFRRSKKKEAAAMEENKVEFTALTPERNEEPEVPASRYTEEYAEFNERQLAKGAERVIEPEAEESLEEQMLADPFADVAAQDEDVDVPAPAAEEPAEEAAPVVTEEEILADPFADVAAQDEDPEQ